MEILLVFARMPAHGERIGLLLLNVGTPDAPRAREVRRYLREFLSDPRVFDAPWPVRMLILHGLILPFRPRRSARAYARIFGSDGRSPLLAIGERFAHALARRLGAQYEVALAMRYGRPTIASALERLSSLGIERILVFPLFPQAASSTTGSAIQEALRLATQPWNVPSISVVPPFYDHPGLARAFGEAGRSVLEDPRPDHVLFSFHGLPERHIRKGDRRGAHCLRRPDCCDAIGPANRSCYRAQCFATARAIAAAAGCDPARWSVAFQSRLGRDPWIRPYTDETLRALAARGVRRVAVFCPAFVADCLETLEEIGIGAREMFREAGGEELRLAPSLNDHPLWVELAAELVERAAGR